MSVLKDFVNKNKTQIQEDLINVVKAESPTHDKKLVDECGILLIDLFKERLGADPYVHVQVERGNHLCFTIGKGSKKILILGHFDTVWEKGQLPIRIKDEKFYGPGVLDMKAGIIQSMWGVKALWDNDLLHDKEITFLLTSDEEVGSGTSREIIEERAKENDAVLVMETPDSGTGAAKTGRKGVGNYKLKIKGKSSHSGAHHEEGISAIKELAQQIILLENMTDYEKGTTVNTGVISGGRRSNIVPDYAEATVDLRVKTMEEAYRMGQLLTTLKPFTPGIELEVEGGMNRPPMERTETNVELFHKAREAALETGFQLEESQVGGASDGNFTAALGVPTLDGLGVPGEGPHAEYEHILINELPGRTEFIANFIKKL
ncbi:M20 family metallopeptidase [Evansella sp. LMS18]|uniref:M20 family metallopeptidase n=1 Tax=Evansella sp. LMS18 TaxID=2924033 RepID=UPI0020D0374E|nr:M20 family metallopeptidase [Evansella sp. LMS18]UTR09878.1 M20 family metallopeptidase [Evansella sp. LMS18]